MDAIRTENYGGIRELLDTMDTGIDMLSAVGSMMEFALNSGEDVRYISAGVAGLFRQQCDDMRFIEQSLRNQFDAMRLEKLKVRDIQEVARSAGVPVEVAETCVFLATGIHFRQNGKLEPERADG